LSRWCLAAILLISTLAVLPAAAAEYELAPGQKAVGELRRYVVKQGDVFPDIARHFDIGYTELVAANPGVDPWYPGAGREIIIPTLHILPEAPRQGIVINLAQWRLFYFTPAGDRVSTFPLGLGVIGKKTPLGATQVLRKEPNPTWYPPPSIRAERPELPAAIPAGPENPLGSFALYLGWKNYLLHGTNKPDGVGRNVSHGCIRLYPEDIAWLFNEVAIGTPVRSVDQPATAGWSGDRLYVQVYPSKSQTEQIDTEQRVSPDPAQGVDEMVRAAAGRYAESVDWGAVHRAAQQRTGMAVLVADRSGVARNSAPGYEREAARSYDNPGSAPRHDGREAMQSSSAGEAPPPYLPDSYYGSSYYGSGAAPPSYDRGPAQAYLPYGAPQRRLYYDREAERWDYAPATEAGEPSDSRFGPFARPTGR